MKRSEWFLWVLAVTLLVLPTDAFGYLDPGTGSMILQIAVGGVLASLAVLRVYWKKVKSIFKPGSRKDPSQ